MNNAASAIGNLDVTNIALGMADFLVERTKTELNTAFFRRFQEELEKPEYADLKLLFPETVGLLQVIGVEIYQFDHYLNALRNAFEKDLRLMLEHCPAVLDRHKSDPVFQADSALIPSLQLMFELAGWIKDQRHPGEVLYLMARSNYADSLAHLNIAGYPEAISTLRLVTLISESLRTNSDSVHYWVSKQQLDALKDTVTFKIYLGFLYEVSKQEPYDRIRLATDANPAGVSATDLLAAIAGHWDTLLVYRRFVLQIGQQTQSTMQAVSGFLETQHAVLQDTTLDRAAKRQRLLDASFDVFHAFLNLTKASFEVEKLPGLQFQIPEHAKRLVHYTEAGGEISLMIVQKQYAGAVSKLAVLLQEWDDEAEKEAAQIQSALQSGRLDSIQQANLTDRKRILIQKYLLEQQCAELRKLPCFAGKKKQLRGLKQQGKALEARLKNYNTKGMLYGNPEYAALLAQITELRRDSSGKTGTVKESYASQIEGIQTQIEGLQQGMDQSPYATSGRLTIKKFLKYGTFMANLVEAETPEAVKKAIEAVALPPGSYTIKRESRFSVALNGYLGVFGGQEVIQGVANKGVNNWALTAPIGISLSWGNIIPRSRRPWSLGFSIPLVDLGAVASYRFGNTEDQTVDAVPTIQLKDLIAPGAFFEVGIAGTPLTFGLGGQMGPRLRKVSDPAGKDIYYRFGATLKVDIPILNFYASPSKR